MSYLHHLSTGGSAPSNVFPQIANPNSNESEDCELCGESDGPFEDVVVNFVDSTDEPRLAHEECGTNAGWKLA